MPDYEQRMAELERANSILTTRHDAEQFARGEAEARAERAEAALREARNLLERSACRDVTAPVIRLLDAALARREARDE
jgi:hypothetical protein